MKPAKLQIRWKGDMHYKEYILVREAVEKNRKD